MELRTVDENNIDEYSDIVDMDVAENIGRLYYHGLAGHDPYDDNILSLLIWELKNRDNNEDSESELKFIYSIDPSYISTLMDGYGSEAADNNVNRTFFESTSLEHGNKEALLQCDFSLEQVESRDLIITADECAKLPLAKKPAPPYVDSLGSLNSAEFYQGLMNILFKYDDPAMDDLAFLPQEWYEQSVSCFTKTDGRITGLLLVHICPSGTLVPVLFFAVGADSRLNLLEMLCFSVRQVMRIYPGDTPIRIHRRNNDVRALFGKLFPNKNGKNAVAGERIEKG